ncbi:hypothetical protein AFL42_06880 [Oceanobacillus caeni]|uniref:Uncharacterized protein n=1 Tax=Oceanobacillus caeni TaxID=405946 RepID=A0ABR5MKA3_9BACI|nr:hypothetical protein AFL42_06880 [Oceanobacillus caeni]
MEVNFIGRTDRIVWKILKTYAHNPQALVHNLLENCWQFDIYVYKTTNISEKSLNDGEALVDNSFMLYYFPSFL